MTTTRSAASQSAPIIDIAIIGGGVAGTYTGYRLMKTLRDDPGVSSVLSHLLQKPRDHTQLDVRLFEMSQRIGGRLWSYRFPGMNLVAELGGQAFSAFQQNVYGLCTTELNLNYEPSSSYNNSYFGYIWGKRYNINPPAPGSMERELTEVSEVHPKAVFPFQAPGDNVVRHPTKVALGAALARIQQAQELSDRLAAIAKALNRCDLSEANRLIGQLTGFLRTVTFKRDGKVFAGKRLYESAFWNVLLSELSLPEYNFALQASHVYTYFRNYNTYNTLLNFFKGRFSAELQQGPWMQLCDGYQTLPETLLKRFCHMKGRVETQKQLRSLQCRHMNGEPLIELTFAESRPVLARNVVLALPQRALQLLDPESVLFSNRRFRNDIDTVTSRAASKLILNYNEPWWECIAHGKDKVPNEQIISGKSVTDLPIRACYYIGAEKDGKAILTCLNDGVMTNFWDGFVRASRLGRHETPYRSRIDDAGETPQCAPDDMVIAAQRQLIEMHGVSYIPEPCATVYRNWMDDPYGGGWHSWNPHVRSWEVMPRIRQPLSDLNIFLCGEAYSAMQGWVEGALNTAEMVLQTHFQLPPPGWVDASYDFGP